MSNFLFSRMSPAFVSVIIIQNKAIKNAVIFSLDLLSTQPRAIVAVVIYIKSGKVYCFLLIQKYPPNISPAVNKE